MWIDNDGRFTRHSFGVEYDLLPKGVYSLKYAPMSPMYLKKESDEFSLPDKIYGHDFFPERVIKTFNSKNSNLGVLFCGIQGTGKTIQAKQICNLSGLPVIIVNEHFDEGKDLVNFISSVQQPVVVMIDEYEKIFNTGDGLLSMMDGAMGGVYPRLFLLTANDANVSPALLDRPSRIYYYKKFGNLSIETIEEVLLDLLDNRAFLNDLIEYFSELKIVTIDIVKTVVDECNLFNEPPSKFKNIFNASSRNKNTWTIVNVETKETFYNCAIYPKFPFIKQSGFDVSVSTRYDDFNLGIVASFDPKTSRFVTDQGTFMVSNNISFENFNMERFNVTV